MATVKLHLDQRRARKDGSHPLVIRLRNANKYIDIPTGMNLSIQEFDPVREYIKGKQKLSSDLQQQKNQYAIQFSNLIAKGMTFEEIKNLMLNKEKETSPITLESFWQDEINRLTSIGRAGGARVYLSSFKGLRKVIDLSLPLKELKYKNLVEAEAEMLKNGVSHNSISVYMRTLRALCNKAINLDIVEMSWYPFKKFKIQKEKTIPRTLSLDEMQTYFSLDLPQSHKWHKSYCIGLLIFLLRGINLKDLLLLSDNNIINGRIVYKRAKTGKLYSIKLLPETEQILSDFSGKETLLGVLDDDIKYIRHDVDAVHRYVQQTKNINSHLRKIGKMLNLSISLSTYVFRYSYANIAKQLGYSKDMIAEALGHEYGNAVTGIYLELFDQEKIDEMNSNILVNVLQKTENR